MLSGVKTKVYIALDKITRYISEHPIFSGIAIIIAYFMFDNEFMIGSGTTLAKDELILSSLFIAYFAYYIAYLRKKLKSNLSDTERKKEILFFSSLIIVTLGIFISYDSLITQYLPSIGDNYYKSEVVVFLILAPIFEEISFRYLLYDKWAKVKYGKIIGGILIGIIFIIFHPINNFIGFAMYWLPTLFLFMTYDSGGIKASITAHMLYNIVALL